MEKNIFETEQYKFKLLAADKYCYTHIIDILKENLKEFKFNKTNDNIEKLITRKPILELLFVNPYFQDEEKYNLLKILKDNIDLIKKNMTFYFDYTSVIFKLTYPVKKSNIYSDHHFIYTRFNVNNFLQMNEKFKETYLNILGKLILTNPETRMQGLHNFFQIFNKEPELSSFLIKELEKINQFSDENFKDIQKYIFEVDKYFQIYKNIYYDKNPELEI